MTEILILIIISLLFTIVICKQFKELKVLFILSSAGKNVLILIKRLYDKKWKGKVLQ